MTLADFEDRLIAVMAETFRLDAAEITHDATSETLENWDSLAHQNLLLALSDAFGVTFSSDEGDGLQDYNSLRTALTAKLTGAAHGSSAPTATPVPPGRPLAISALAPVPQTRANPHLPPVIVIGDSNTRSFAYHAAFLPLSIGQGARANLLTPTNRAFVAGRIANIMAHADPSFPIMLCLPSTFMHHFRDTFGTLRKGANEDAENEAFLGAMAEEYVQLACKIRDEDKRRVAIAAVPPVHSPAYRRGAAAFNVQIKTACARQGIPFMEGFTEVLDERLEVKDSYWGDSWHINPAVAATFATLLVQAGFLQSDRGGDHAWSYRYFIPADVTPIDVWGDFAQKSLVLERPDLDYDLTTSGATASQTFRWERYHEKTHYMEDVMASLCGVLELWRVTVPGPIDATILDCREGFAAFAWTVSGTRRVTGLDRDSGKIARAKWLAPFYKIPTAFEAVERYGDTLDETDVLVALERIEFTDDYYGRFFKTSRAKAKVFAFLSDVGVPHIALLRRAGFADVMQIPITAADGTVHLPRSRKVTNDTRVAATGCHLLLAFTQTPARAFRDALAARLAGQLERHKKRAGEQLAAHFETMQAQVKG